jgi:hypothetical protein
MTKAIVKVFRKMTTKPMWYWERNRPYLSKLYIYRLRKLKASSASKVPKINILCTPSTIIEAVYSAWSWCNQLGNEFGIRIIIDGNVSASLQRRYLPIIDGLVIQSVNDLINPSLSSYSALSLFGRQHPLGRKLLLLLSLQQHEELIYSDNDVLVFNPPQYLLSAFSAKQAVYNRETNKSAFDEHLLGFALHLGSTPAELFNSGLIYCPQRSLDISFAEELASVKTLDNYTWFDEQTILALLMNKAGAKPLNPSHYVVSIRRQFWWDNDEDYSSIATRHFTGPVRHLMYSKGHPLLLRTCK